MECMSLLTYGMHESAVYVGVEQVGHGLHGTVAEGAQVGRAPFAVGIHRFVLFFLRTVVQQIHKQCQISTNTRE
jgi:hypothetical protein